MYRSPNKCFAVRASDLASKNETKMMSFPLSYVLSIMPALEIHGLFYIFSGEEGSVEDL